VFGGVYDYEFECESILLFEKLAAGLIRCVYSGLTETELIKAPERVKLFFEQLNQDYLEKVDVCDPALSLARKYIERDVVGPTNFDDCVHIALATIHEVDILISWNFKHIVNPVRIPGYNSVNLYLGYKSIEIRSPKDILHL
jgi:hypothetical protein